MSEQRLIDLETKFSYQEMQIEELKQTVHDQFLVIDRLERQVNQLIQQIKQSGESTIRPNEKPPHY